jgi:hypothetical protein
LIKYNIMTVSIGPGWTIGPGFTISGGSGVVSFTIPYPDGVGAPGNFLWVGGSLSNANIVALINLGDLTGYKVTATDNPSLTGTISSMNPVGYWGFAESPAIGYAVGRQLIVSNS